MDIKYCKKCEKEFIKKSSESRKFWATRIYCSHSCANSINSLGNTHCLGKIPWSKGKKFGKSPRNTRLNLNCIECGKEFEIQKYRKNTAKFCSKKCTDMFKDEGKTNINYRQRRLFQQTIQKRVFERDKYACQLCGQFGGDLQVDHIQPWAEYVKGRFSMDNCRTLCAKCHYQITFGKPMPRNTKGWGHNMLNHKAVAVVEEA